MSLVTFAEMFDFHAVYESGFFENRSVREPSEPIVWICLAAVSYHVTANYIIKVTLRYSLHSQLHHYTILWLNMKDVKTWKSSRLNK